LVAWNDQFTNDDHLIDLCCKANAATAQNPSTRCCLERVTVGIHWLDQLTAEKCQEIAFQYSKCITKLPIWLISTFEEISTPSLFLFHMIALIGRLFSGAVFSPLSTDVVIVVENHCNRSENSKNRCVLQKMLYTRNSWPQLEKLLGFFTEIMLKAKTYIQYSVFFSLLIAVLDIKRPISLRLQIHQEKLSQFLVDTR